MSETADHDAARTIVFPHVVAKRHAEVAIARQDEILRRNRAVDALLRIDGRDYSSNVLDLGGDSFVAEVHSPGSPFPFTLIHRVIVNGKPHHRGYASRDLAILAYLDLSHGGDGSAVPFAARVLNVEEG